LRISLVVVPLITALFTYKFCRDLAAEHRHPPGHERPEPEPQPPSPDGETDEHESLSDRARDTAGAIAGAAVIKGLASWERHH
jgi:hypothetical protein